MSYPVHLRLTRGTAAWLAGQLINLAGEDEAEAEGLLDMADSLNLVAEGRYDIAGAHPEHYEVVAP